MPPLLPDRYLTGVLCFGRPIFLNLSCSAERHPEVKPLVSVGPEYYRQSNRRNTHLMCAVAHLTLAERQPDHAVDGPRPLAGGARRGGAVRGIRKGLALPAGSCPRKPSEARGAGDRARLGAAGCCRRPARKLPGPRRTRWAAGRGGGKPSSYARAFRRNTGPAAATTAPAPRSATRPAGQRCTRPTAMPSACSKPVAITKPRL